MDNVEEEDELGGGQRRVASKKAVINPKNEDEECFKWGIIASLYHTEIERDPQRISKLRPYVDLYNWQGIEFPTSIKSIYKFEDNNQGIAVNVLYVTGKRIDILRQSHHTDRSKQVNLLLITNDKKTHYTAVKSLSRLLGIETSKNTAEMNFFLNCLQAFPTVESRHKHHGYCKDHEAVKITLPTEAEKWQYYRDSQQHFKVPIAISADFESLLIPVGDARGTKTEKLSKHVPSGWCTYSTFACGSVPDPLTVYRGEDCVTRFVNHLEDEVKRLYYTYPQQPMMPLTEVLKREHEEASKCHIFLKPFDDCENNRKVRDHRHYTGLYRGAAHNSCNLKYKIPSHIPVIFHNLSGYDAHLFIRELGEKYDTQDIGCIAENTEEYISFNVKINIPLGGMGYGDGETYKKIEIRFIDSCRFMLSSLDKLASNLIGINAAGMKCHQCADTYLEFQGIDAECMEKFWCKNCDSNTTKQLNRDQVKANVPSMANFIDKDDTFRLMLRKGVYSYKYKDRWQRFEELELPPKESFYSKLNMKGISDNEYAYAKKVWNCITLESDNIAMGDYHDLYLSTDVLLIAEVFETFRDVCLTNYKLDPSHFYSAPGLAWKAALKYTGIRLELLTAPDMLLMFEKGIRGSITQAVHRYAKANNKYMGDQYDPEVESSHLQYLDANNLYGWAMRQDLPTDGFKWVSNTEAFTEKRIEKLVRDNKHGYILEVDIDYPKRLHDKHNELPFLPERMHINRVEKLVPNLGDKRRYVVHTRALNEAIKHGLELKTVRRVIQFNQKPWLKGYITTRG
ncbi:uncharacterized protein LOC130657804 [Hydractinia symbiolongicarpus]|uniref:uncharacterized protein LOC130657804 n=1 Tax=Hydractinia symbiolongicarpus TaxID=13093 RepID=UPI00254F4666|nr:uncharacterized protein LOC130657804 [Hydractinia symbiolongicarpus]